MFDKNKARVGGSRRTVAALAALLAVSGPGLGVVLRAEAAEPFGEAPQLTANPNPRVPLAALVEVKTTTTAGVRLNVHDGERAWSVTYPPAVAGTRSLPLLGLRADRDHAVIVEATDAEGAWRRHPQTLHFRTPPLPSSRGDFPPLQVRIADTARMEPGYTFLSIRRRVPGRANWSTQAQRDFMTKWGAIVALDERGEVVWYYQSDERIAGINPLRNGNLLMHTTGYRSVEIDLLGNEVGSWHAEKRPRGNHPGSVPIRGVKTLHHQPFEMENGNLLSLSANPRLVEGYYTSETDPEAPRKPQLVMGDTIIEFTRKGDIAWSWNAFDHLDPMRIGYDTINPYWHVRGFPETLDWTHGNGVTHDPSDDSVIVNFKHQDALMKIDRRTGRIKWILGEPTDWPAHLQDKLLRPVGDPFRWSYHAHNPWLTERGTIIIYDNGTFQARPFRAPVPPDQTFSRAVEFEVDENNMTVRQVWATHHELGEDTCFSSAMGDARWLPQRDHVLVVDSICNYRDPGLAWDPFDETRRNIDDVFQWSRTREYTRDDPAQVVFEVQARDPDELLQWQTYGGYRVPSLYGGFGAVVEPVNSD